MRFVWRSLGRIRPVWLRLIRFRFLRWRKRSRRLTVVGSVRLAVGRFGRLWWGKGFCRRPLDR